MSKDIMKYEFKYLGDSYSIDLNTLLVSQFQYFAILNEIKNELYPDVELKIKVQSVEKGSFSLSQLIEIATVGSTLFFSNIDYLKSIFEVLKAYIDIKKILGEQKPLSITQVGDNGVSIVIQGNNNPIIFNKDAFAIYNKNYAVDKAFSKNIEILSADPEIDGISIREQGSEKEIVHISREEFSDLSVDNPYMKDDTKVKIVENTTLYIRKLDINPQKNTKWDFIYDGRRIGSVIISDEAFLDRVRNGLRFGNGDRLIADLKIYQKVDLSTGAYLDNKYEVVKVYNVQPKPEQNSLF